MSGTYYNPVFAVTVTAKQGQRPLWDFNETTGKHPGDKGQFMQFTPTGPGSITFNLPSGSSYLFNPNYFPTIFNNSSQIISSPEVTNGNLTLTLAVNGALPDHSTPISIFLFVVDGKGNIHVSPDPSADPQGTGGY
ncbi:MAG TPA: hypothetical protein VF472_04075 [Burkholderiaceae bacterium]